MQSDVTRKQLIKSVTLALNFQPNGNSDEAHLILGSYCAVGHAAPLFLVAD